MDQTETRNGTVDFASFTPLADGDAQVKTLTEKQLAENFENHAIRSIVVDEVPGGYELHVTLTWRKDGPFRLVKFRGTESRLWRSLDGLVKFLKAFDGVPPLVLRLLPKETDSAEPKSEN